MGTLPSRYWRMFDENSNMGELMSAHVGGIGKDAGQELKQPLSVIFTEWRKKWQKQGLLPKRQRKGSL